MDKSNFYKADAPFDPTPAGLICKIFFNVQKKSGFLSSLMSNALFMLSFAIKATLLS